MFCHMNMPKVSKPVNVIVSKAYQTPLATLQLHTCAFKRVKSNLSKSQSLRKEAHELRTSAPAFKLFRGCLALCTVLTVKQDTS
ncbi:hypothetical protein AN958_05637 [Leucoagaricus sp. SymC.cos]|nr:hypothetical protein AN958_05637 [Leucoagaricus sp. SymC.cos]